MVQSLLIKYKLMWIYRSSRSWNRLMTFLPNNMSWDLGNIHTRRILKRKWDQNDICLSPLITTKDRLFFFRKLIFLKGMFISMLWLLNYIFNAVHSHKIYKDNCKPFKECIFLWTWWYICKSNWHLKTFRINACPSLKIIHIWYKDWYKDYSFQISYTILRLEITYNMKIKSSW